MNCEKFMALLDAYVDNALSTEEKEQFLMHAETCEICKTELQNAEMLRNLLAEMNDDVAVPLEAQAAWRRAVREEAQKRKTKSLKRIWMRASYAAAAVLVVLLGTTLVFRNDTDTTPKQPLELATVENDGANEKSGTAEKAEADGVANFAMAKIATETESAGTDGSYTARKKISVMDYVLACETIEALTGEYSGTSSVEKLEGEAIYRVEIPYAYMTDFLNSVARIGVELDSEIVDEASETAIVCIQICNAE